MAAQITQVIPSLGTPPTTADPSSFDTRADALLGTALPAMVTAENVFATQANALSTEVSAKAAEAETDAATASAAASAAVASANAVLWVSAGSYTAGQNRYSPINYLTYRAITTHSGETTDPSLDATNWVKLTTAIVGDHSIIVHTANGYGSTNTKIRRYTTTQTSVGTAITYADSSTLGASFTINAAGFYTMTALDAGSAANSAHGISLNTTTPTTNIQIIAVGERLGYVYTALGGGANTTVITVYLSSEDIIRPHNDGTTGNIGARYCAFYIRKVG